MKLPWVDTRVALIHSAVVGLLRYAPLMLRFVGARAAAALRELQAAVDAAARFAANAYTVATDVLRLPPSAGGFGVPDIREEVDIACVAELQRTLNSRSVAADCFEIELDRVGFRARYAAIGVAAPAWPAAHPLETLHPLSRSAYIRPGELSSRAVAAQRRATSTVFSIASGRSANSAVISSAVLK